MEGTRETGLRLTGPGARRLELHVQHDSTVIMRADCRVCRAEGLSAHTQVLVTAGDKDVLATLYRISSDLIAANEIGLSEDAWQRLGVSDGDRVVIRTRILPESLGRMRRRIYGYHFDGLSSRGHVLSCIADCCKRAPSVATTPKEA